MLKTELLSGNHDRESFDCGEPALNEFLLKTARQHIRKGISRTFVLIDETVPNDILGYYTLTACEIHSDQFPEKYRKKYPFIVPGAKLARMAVHLKHHRKKYGTAMMGNAIERILSVADNIGIIGFFVDAKNNDAKIFYQRFGFLSLSEPLKLFLPLQTLQKAYETAGKVSG